MRLTIQDEGCDEVGHSNYAWLAAIILPWHAPWVLIPVLRCHVPVLWHVASCPPGKVDAASQAHAEQQAKHEEDDVVYTALNAAALGWRLGGIHEDLCVVTCTAQDSAPQVVSPF